MTREHKLALLVGFGLVLIVGILVADHFSDAKNARISMDLDAGTPQQFGSPTGSPAMLASALPAPAFGSPGIEPEPLPPAWPEPQRQEPSLVLTMGERPQLGRDPLESADLSSPASRTGLSNLAWDRAPTAAELSLRSPDYQAPTQPQAQPQAREAEAAPRQAPVVPELPVSRGRLQRHEVVAGDNLTKIAQRYYQDGSLWRRLQNYNGDRVSGDGVVRVGTTLMIPPKDVLMGQARLGNDTVATPEQARPAPAPENRRQAEPARGTPAKSEPAKPAPRTYVVKPGDTLGKIAQQHLGTSRRWTEIRDMNKKTLDDADSIQVGMKLTLPAE